VRSGGASEAWRDVLYVVFDAPASAAPFEERMDELRALFTERRPAYAHWHAHVRCEGVEHLRAELARVEALGGEGLMLRRPGSRYEIGRSSSLLKVKTFLDAEARVVGHAPGAGKHKGRLGALEAELADGTRFSIGTGLSDAERTDPPPIGSVVTFRYQELSDDGVPRFPSYVGVRIDARVGTAAAREAPSPNLKPSPRPKPEPSPKPEPNPGPKPKQPASASAPRLSADPPSLTISLELPGKPGKSWCIEVRGAQHVVRFGARGAAGQMRLTAFATEAEARADAQKRAATKRREGYR
jgi:DNA ligase-1